MKGKYLVEDSASEEEPVCVLSDSGLPVASHLSHVVLRWLYWYLGFFSGDYPASSAPIYKPLCRCSECMANAPYYVVNGRVYGSLREARWGILKHDLGGATEKDILAVVRNSRLHQSLREHKESW